MSELFDSHGVSAVLRDGRIMAFGKFTQVESAGGNIAVVVRLPDLKYIEKVVEIEFYTDPMVNPGNVVNKKLHGNIVGFTLVNLGGGTTLTTEVLGLG